MTPADRAAFGEVIAGLAELKGRVLSKPAIELFWRAMQDWPLDEFRAAAAHLVRTCPFMPSPADFDALRRAGRPTSGEAWLQAVRCAATSAYRHCETPGGVIDRAVAAIGGYSAIGMCDESKLHFLERRFAEHYESMSGADDTRAALPQVTSRASLPRPVAEILEKLGGPK